MVTLVDLDDRPVGSAEKEEAHAKPLLHRAFSVFITDPEGKRMLLQRRARGKYHSGGLWTNACCSHPEPGEDLVPAARRRLGEELGIGCDLREIGRFVYLHRFAEHLYEYEYDHVLIGRYSGPVYPDPEEAEEVRWMDMDAVRGELLADPERFTPWFVTAAPIVFDHPKDMMKKGEGSL